MIFNKYYATFLALVVVQSVVLFSQGVPMWPCGVIGFLSGVIYSVGVSRGEK